MLGREAREEVGLDFKARDAEASEKLLHRVHHTGRPRYVENALGIIRYLALQASGVDDVADNIARAHSEARGFEEYFFICHLLFALRRIEKRSIAPLPHFNHMPRHAHE